MRVSALIFLLAAPFLAFAEEASHIPLPPSGLLTSIDSEPSAMVGGCINVISGEFIDYEKDMSIPAPKGFGIERALINNNPHPYIRVAQEPPRWSFNHESTVLLKENVYAGDPEHHYLADYEGPLGDTLYFNLHKKKHKEHVISGFRESMLKYGFTNAARGVIGAQTNIRNNLLRWNVKSETCELHTSNGSILLFEGYHTCPIKREIRPDWLQSTYDSDRRLTKRNLLNASGTLLASYSVEYTDSDHHHPIEVYKALDGRKTVYSYEDMKVKGHRDTHRKKGHALRTVIRDDAPSVCYAYTKGILHRVNERDFYEWPKVFRKSYPNNRFLQLNYYQPGSNLVLGSNHPIDRASSHHNRVSQLLAPLGPDETPIPQYQFLYNLPQGPGGAGCAGVYDALLHKTDYDFNARQRLTRVVKYQANGAPYTEETLHWGPENTLHEIELNSRIFGVLGHPYKTFCRNYIYDGIGNIVEERLYGNLTGLKEQPLQVDLNGRPTDPTIECQVKSYSYSNDRFHLLEHSYEGPLEKVYRYYPETNLLVSTLQLDKGTPFLRDFYDYDENGLVIRHIIDDGTSPDRNDLTGVTERKIEAIARSRSYPFGLPLIVTHSYLDLQSGQELLASCQVNTYSIEGNLVQQDLLDSTRTFHTRQN